MEEVVKALRRARIETEEGSEEEDEEEDAEPAPAVAPVVAPAVPAPVGDFIEDVKQVRLNKEEKDYIVKIHKTFLDSVKEIHISKDGKDFKNEAGFVFRSVGMDMSIKNPSTQKFFLVGAKLLNGNECLIFPSLTSINKKYKDNMNAIEFILPISGNWRRRVVRRAQ
eukprot:g21085.t1